LPASAVVGNYLHCSESQLYAVEGGYRIFNLFEVRGLVETVYKRPDLVEEIELLRSQAENAERFSPVEPRASLYVELEKLATGIIDTTIDGLPGLFQLPEWSTAQHIMHGHSEADARKYTEIRIDRQELLVNPQPPTVDCLITESALDRAFYVPGQLEALSEWARVDNVSIRVLPNSVGPHIFVAGFIVLQFDSKLGLSSLIHTDTLLGASITHDDDVVSTSLAERAKAMRYALGVEDTMSMIESKI
jgi:hypothetical protein